MNGTPKGTLEELEGGDKWTESPDDTFPIIALCRLARKPLDKFTIARRASLLAEVAVRAGESTGVGRSGTEETADSRRQLKSGPH